MARDSIVFYRSFFEAIELQPKKLRPEIYYAFFKYAFDDESVEISDRAKSVFMLMKPQIDANNRKYENGKKGGRPKKNKTYGFENEEEKTYFEKPNVNDNENNNDNDNVNINDNNNAADSSSDEPSMLDRCFEAAKKGIYIPIDKNYPNYSPQLDRILWKMAETRRIINQQKADGTYVDPLAGLNL